jgi:hypothetical protein
MRRTTMKRQHSKRRYKIMHGLFTNMGYMWLIKIGRMFRVCSELRANHVHADFIFETIV